LGATLANGGLPEEAIEAYRKALDLRPTFTRATYNLGVSCLNIGCYKEAAEHLLAAIEGQRVHEVTMMKKTHRMNSTQASRIRDSLDKYEVSFFIYFYFFSFLSPISLSLTFVLSSMTIFIHLEYARGTSSFSSRSTFLSSLTFPFFYDDFNLSRTARSLKKMAVRTSGKR
jgi:tetratricopeptide (TPR) repeat protein